MCAGHPLHGRIRAHACVEATAMLPTFSSGRSWTMRMVDASGDLRLLDGGTGGRVLSFSRAETALPSVNQGAGRPRGVLEAGAAVSVRRIVPRCHIRAHYPRREPRFECAGRLIGAGRLIECLGGLPAGLTWASFWARRRGCIVCYTLLHTCVTCDTCNSARY